MELNDSQTLEKTMTKTELAESLGLSRQALYYKPKMPVKDLALKLEIEKVLAKHQSYGHKRVAMELGINKKESVEL